MNDIEGFAVHATDGPIGHVKDLYFDDRAWVVRYLVVEAGSWLSSRKVLIPAISVGRMDWNGRVLSVSITKRQVKNSPDIDTDRPVSRQHEMQYLRYYNYSYYWEDRGPWGAASYPVLTPAAAAAAAGEREAEARQRKAADPHLRSCNAVKGYGIEATDGDIGHVHDLLVDEATGAVRYMVVATGAWWVGREVLVAPQWIHEVRWSDSSVAVTLTRQSVRDAPQYDAAVPLNRDWEADLHRHHGRSGYWLNNEEHP